MPSNLNEEAFAVSTCIFDDCASHAASIRENLKNAAFQESYEAAAFNLKSASINDGQMADSNADIIFGTKDKPATKSICNIKYNSESTEVQFIMGWDASAKNALEKDREKAEAKRNASFRFKQLNKEVNGFRLKLGGRNLLYLRKGAFHPF